MNNNKNSNVDTKKFKLLYSNLITACESDDLSGVKDIFKNDGFLSHLKNEDQRFFYIMEACLHASKQDSKKAVNYLFNIITRKNDILTPSDVLPIIGNRLEQGDEDFYLKFVSKNSGLMSGKNNNYANIIKGCTSIVFKNCMKNPSNANILKLMVNDFNNNDLLLVAVGYSTLSSNLNYFDIITEKLKENDFLKKAKYIQKEKIIKYIILHKSSNVGDGDYFAEKLMDMIDLEDVKKYINLIIEIKGYENKNYQKSVGDVIYNYIYPIKEKEFLVSSIKNKNPQKKLKIKKI